MWRRVWDSNPRAQRANGFQDRLVMTTSITLRRVSLAKCSGIWREFRERTMKFLYDGKCRKPLIWQGFWGNKRNSYARVFKTASLWPLRYLSVYMFKLKKAQHSILNFLGSASLCPVAVPEILCSHLLTKFRPLPLLITRYICHGQHSWTSPLR